MVISWKGDETLNLLEVLGCDGLLGSEILVHHNQNGGDDREEGSEAKDHEVSNTLVERRLSSKEGLLSIVTEERGCNVVLIHGGVRFSFCENRRYEMSGVGTLIFHRRVSHVDFVPKCTEGTRHDVSEGERFQLGGPTFSTSRRHATSKDTSEFGFKVPEDKI